VPVLSLFDTQRACFGTKSACFGIKNAYFVVVWNSTYFRDSKSYIFRFGSKKKFFFRFSSGFRLLIVGSASYKNTSKLT
jgi:hypothetical protein